MKKNIHPKYFEDAKIICSCGKVWHIPSTVKEMKVEICANCHPFFTGEEKFVDTRGQLEKFKKRLEKMKKNEKGRDKKVS